MLSQTTEMVASRGQLRASLKANSEGALSARPQVCSSALSSNSLSYSVCNEKQMQMLETLKAFVANLSEPVSDCSCRRGNSLVLCSIDCTAWYKLLLLLSVLLLLFRAAASVKSWG
jgi:hypothetical protein